MQIDKCDSVPLQDATPKDSMWCDQLMKWALPFDMANGVVSAIYPDPRENRAILNLKRGIVSAFQVKPKGKDNVQIVDEVKHHLYLLTKQ